MCSISIIINKYNRTKRLLECFHKVTFEILYGLVLQKSVTASGFESRSVQSVASRYTDWNIPARLFIYCIKCLKSSMPHAACVCLFPSLLFDAFRLIWSDILLYLLLRLCLFNDAVFTANETDRTDSSNWIKEENIQNFSGEPFRVHLVSRRTMLK